MNSDFLEKLNELYQTLAKKTEDLALLLSGFGKCEYGWYNGHFHKDDGKWVKEYYPIPVISVKGLCDIEVGLETTTLSAKLGRDAAAQFPFETLSGCEFEVYGVQNYLSDFYRDGITTAQMRENICSSEEAEIGFSFAVDRANESEQLVKLVGMLKDAGFYN